MSERVYTVTDPSGTKIQVRAHDGATDEELIRLAQSQASLKPIEKKPATFEQAALASPLGAYARGTKDFIDAGAQLLPRGVSFVSSAGGLFPNVVSEWADKEAGRVDAMNQEGFRSYDDARWAAGKEGFDGFRLLGNVAGPGGIGIARTLTRAAPALGVATTGARAMSGAAGGAAGGLMTPVENTDETSFAMQKTGQVLAGGVGGAVASPLLGKVFDKLAPLGKRFMATFAGGDAINRQAADQVNEAINAVIRESGGEISPMARESLSRQVMESLKSGKQLDAAAALRKQDFGREGLPSLLGQITRDPKQFSTERNLYGVEGIGDELRNVLQVQNAGIRSRLDKMGAARANSSFRAGEDMIGALSKEDEKMAAAIRAAYRNVRASNAKDWDIPLQGLAQDAAEVIDTFGVGAERNAIPSAIFSKLKDFGMVGDPRMTQTRVFNFEEADKLLKQINSHANGGPNASLDALRNAVKRSLLDAGDGVSDPYALPRKMAAERFKIMDAVPALKAAADGSASPDAFVQRFIIDGKTKEVTRLAGILPDEAKAEARRQILTTLRRAAFGEDMAGDKTVAPERFAKAIRNMGADKLKAFFNPDEIEQLYRLGRISAYIGSEPAAASVSKGSNIGGALFNQLGRMPGMSGTVSTVQALSRPFVQGTQAASAMRATVPQTANLTAEEIALASGLLNAGGFAAGGFWRLALNEKKTLIRAMPAPVRAALRYGSSIPPPARPVRAFSFSPAMLRRSIYIAALLLAGCGGSPSPIPEAAAATRRPLTVVIGDSITAGYIPTAGVLQLRQDLSYTSDVAQLGDVVTAAVGGASTQAALGTQVPWLRSLPADVLVIMLGTNDAVMQLDRAKALANVGAIANAWPKARLVLVAPPYWDAAAAPWLAAWASDLRALAAARGARFVDAYTASRSDWLCHPTDHHPCEAAHREIGGMVRAAAFAP